MRHYSNNPPNLLPNPNRSHLNKTRISSISLLIPRSPTRLPINNRPSPLHSYKIPTNHPTLYNLTITQPYATDHFSYSFRGFRRMNRTKPNTNSKNYGLFLHRSPRLNIYYPYLLPKTHPTQLLPVHYNNRCCVPDHKFNKSPKTINTDNRMNKSTFT